MKTMVGKATQGCLTRQREHFTYRDFQDLLSLIFLRVAHLALNSNVEHAFLAISM